MEMHGQEMQGQEWESQELEETMEEKIRKVVRDEQALILSALRNGLDHALLHYLTEHGFEEIPEELRAPSRLGTDADEEARDQTPLVDPALTKGIHKKTIQAAELVAQILRDHGSLRLSHLKEEVEKRGGNLGSNPTILMKSIMKICPAVQKTGRGRFTFLP
ncbi:hypothetical protein SAMN05444487_10140 [Marininema mesophilum]|uniref:Repressor Rok winged helix domain-containing protein n=1 Tax=Marininema mesophilum TaxID=1048340 RepID=A0A1H2PZQ1_9BACL|nr:hypothetical protein [Marininema mesophilum]SDW00300.1 hypothetical protein SAMN05444487_10140 [Marininema mesophilum]